MALTLPRSTGGNAARTLGGSGGVNPTTRPASTSVGRPGYFHDPYSTTGWSFMNGGNHVAANVKVPGANNVRISNPYQTGLLTRPSTAPAPVAPGAPGTPAPAVTAYPLEDSQYQSDISTALMNMQKELNPWQSELQGLQAVNPQSGQTLYQTQLAAAQRATEGSRISGFANFGKQGLTRSGAKDQFAGQLADQYRTQTADLSNTVGANRINTLQGQVQQRQQQYELERWQAMMSAAQRAYGGTVDLSQLNLPPMPMFGSQSGGQQ
jgi:hypothetical protein